MFRSPAARRHADGPGGLVFVERPPGAPSQADLLAPFLAPWLEGSGRAAVVSTELTTMRFVDEMHSRGHDLEERLLRGDLLFVPVYGLMGRRHPRKDVMPRLRRAREMRGRALVVVDRFSTLLSDHCRASSPQAAWREAEETLRFFRTLRRVGTTVMLTFEAAGLDPRIVALFRGTADKVVAAP